MGFGLMVGVTALYVCLALLVLVSGGWLARDCLRHFRIFRTAKAYGLEPVGMIIGDAGVVIGVALDPGGAGAGRDRFAGSRLCAVAGGQLEPLDSEVIWRMQRSRRVVWYGLLRGSGGIGRSNLMGFLRSDATRRRVPSPEYSDLDLEQSVFLERLLPLLVIGTVLGLLYFYAMK